MNHLNITFHKEENPHFQGLSDELIDFIKYLDFSRFEESDCIHNKVEILMQSVKRNVNFIRTAKSNIDTVQTLIKELEEFVIGFFIQIYQKTSTHIVVCRGKNRIISNEAFKSFTGKDTNDTPEELYSPEELKKIGLYVQALLSEKVVGYKEIFSTKKGDIAWTTLKLPYNGNINIRLGFEVGENKNYTQFYSKGGIKTIHFQEESFYFTKQISRQFEKIRKIESELGSEKSDIDTLLNHIKILALILDYLIIFSPNPLAFYKGKRPLIFSESYCRLTGYSKEELFTYFEENGELNSLLYKGEDGQKVNEFVAKANSAQEVGNGYDGVYFTLTSKTGQRISIPWSNHIYFDKSNTPENNLSLRSGDLGKIQFI